MTSNNFIEYFQRDDAAGLVSYVVENLISVEANENVCGNIESSHHYAKVKDILSKCLTIVNKNIQAEQLKASKAAIETQLSASGDICGTEYNNNLLVIDDAQFIEPRGRFKTSISVSGLLLEGKSISGFIPWTNIANCACVPSSVTTKKEGEDLLVFTLGDKPIKMNNKDTKSFIWTLSKSTTKQINATNGLIDISGTESHVVNALISKYTLKPIDIPRSDLFITVTTQKSYLRCYKGIQEGVIYLLKSGIIFAKPLLYIGAEEISSISAGRGGSSGATRYIDLIIETIDDHKHEFTNIEREDLPALNNYVKGYLEARSKQAANSVIVKRENQDDKLDFNNMQFDEDDDDDDDDFNPDDDDNDDDDDDDSSSSASENGMASTDDETENISSEKRKKKIIDKLPNNKIDKIKKELDNFETKDSVIDVDVKNEWKMEDTVSVTYSIDESPSKKMRNSSQ